jgi:phasin family protein
MSTKPEAAIAAASQRNLEAAMKLAELSFDNSRRMIEFQLGIAREMFAQSVQNMQEAGAVKEPAELAALRARFAQDATQRMLAATRKIAEMTTEFQTELGKALSAQIAGGTQAFAQDFAQNLSEAMQHGMKGLPTNPAEAFAAMEKTFAASREAFEQIAKQAFAGFQTDAKPATRAPSKKTSG